MDDYSQYSFPELIQTIGKLYMDISRSQVVIQQLQQIIKDKDEIIAEVTHQCNCTNGGQDECGQTGKITT